VVVEHVVDARGLEPPEPLERVLAALRELRPGENVLMRHRREPLPLYAMLDAMGFVHRTLRDRPAEFRIWIWRSDDAAAAARCGPPDTPP
jgi:uncharacterized protein (DUF2249 family)